MVIAYIYAKRKLCIGVVSDMREAFPLTS